MRESIVIRIVGDSGDGVQLVGEQLTLSAALTGLDVRTLPDFPAEIRAPAGTLAGVSGFQLALSEQAIFTAGEQLDVLVVMNPAALKHSIEYLKTGGLLIVNEEGFTKKDWEKIGETESFFLEHTAHVQVVSLPLVSRTLMAVKGHDVTHTQAKKAKNFYILGVVLWLFDLTTQPCEAFIAEKFKLDTSIAQANRSTLLAGYNYAMTLEWSRHTYQCKPVTRPAGTYRQVTGIEALSMALATYCVKTKHTMLVAGYPITPASAILQSVAKLSSFGIALFQAEDEIAAICACLGAAFGGKLALTCTSGPGFDLKTEALGLAVVAELPLVVVDVQRAGASTGMPTKTGQSDLNQAMYGRHGEAPLPVIAASSPANCFETTLKAFEMAIRYMTPVIVLLDAYLVNATERWLIPDANQMIVPDIDHNRFNTPYHRDDQFSRSWNVPGTPGYIHQLGGLEKQGEHGGVSYDAQNHAAMIEMRRKKIEGIATTYLPTVIQGPKTAKMLLMSWGSTEGSVKTALQQCAEAGVDIAHLHLHHLFPLPNDLGHLLQHYQVVMVAELNTGHLYHTIRGRYLIDARLISQCNGQPFVVTRLSEAILEEARRAVI